MDNEKKSAIKIVLNSIILEGCDLFKIGLAEKYGHKELANQYRKEFDFKYRREEGTPV